MLAYFSYGKRRYFEKPIPPGTPRPFWEFQAVLQGRIGKTKGRNGEIELRSSSLWLSPPGSSHGWTGEAGKESRIAVFHFRYIPESLSAVIGKGNDTVISLSRKDCRQLHELAALVEPYWREPSPGMLLCYEHALLQLSFLVYEILNVPSGPSGKKSSEMRVSGPKRLFPRL